MLEQKHGSFTMLPLVLVALLANVSTVLFFELSGPISAPTLDELIPKIIWLPIMWLLSMVIAVVVAIRNRKMLFGKSMLKWTLPILLLCTPITLSVINELLSQNASIEAETEHIRGPGYVIRQEEWVYAHGGAIAVTKYYRLNKDDDQGILDDLYKEDSTWTYFDKKGNILKIEKYKDGKLIDIAKN
jgi:hypothetical protein